MSEPDEVPELSPEAKSFLAKHEGTGEAPVDGLERGRQRLAAVGRGSTPARRTARRRWLAPEVMAAAAVVALVLGVQLLYLVFRAPAPLEVKTPEPVTKRGDPEVDAVVAAWRTGNFDGASQLVSTACSSEACRPLAADLNSAVRLARRIDSLSAGELDELGVLDLKLAAGRESLVSKLLMKHGVVDAPLEPAARAEAERLLAEATDEKRAKNYERALIRLQQCIKTAPAFHPCYRLMGSVYASIANRDQSASDLEKARQSYEKFLELAPADDEYRARVQAILQAADEGSAPAAPTPLTAREDSKTKADDLTASPGEEETAVSVPLGGAIELTMPNLQRIAIGDPGVADVTALGGNKLRITGVAVGKTTLLVWSVGGARKSIRVQVGPGGESTIQKLFASASRARAIEDWRSAFLLSNQVLQRDPNHVGAQSIIASARTRARYAYLRGYQLRNESPAEAVRFFKEAMAMTPPDDETHRKAEFRIRELER